MEELGFELMFYVAQVHFSSTLYCFLIVRS